MPPRPEHLYQFVDTWFDLSKIVSISECRVKTKARFVTRDDYSNRFFMETLILSKFGCSVVFANDRDYLLHKRYFFAWDSFPNTSAPNLFFSRISTKKHEYFSLMSEAFTIRHDQGRYEFLPFTTSSFVAVLEKIQFPPYITAKTMVNDFIAAWKAVQGAVE